LSRVVIISNDWKTLNRNVVALQDRGYTLVFEPTAEEVHQKTGEWFREDQDIYDWFGDNLHLVKEPSMRTYLPAAELKRAGMDWMDIVPRAPRTSVSVWLPNCRRIVRTARKNREPGSSSREGVAVRRLTSTIRVG